MVSAFVGWMEKTVREHRIAVYITTICLLVASIIGIYQVKISGSLIEDMPKSAAFFDD